MQLKEQRKTAKELAEGYKRGSYKDSDDTTVIARLSQILDSPYQVYKVDHSVD